MATYKFTKDLYVTYSMCNSTVAMVTCHSAGGEQIPWPANVVLRRIGALSDQRPCVPEKDACYIKTYESYILSVDGVDRLAIQQESGHRLKLM